MFGKSAVSEAPESGGINGQLTVCFSILLVFIQYNISVSCKSAQSVAFYARRTTTIFWNFQLRQISHFILTEAQVNNFFFIHSNYF